MIDFIQNRIFFDEPNLNSAENQHLTFGISLVTITTSPAAYAKFDQDKLDRDYLPDPC
jgi:hypothetical protein